MHHASATVPHTAQSASSLLAPPGPRNNDWSLSALCHSYYNALPARPLSSMVKTAVEACVSVLGRSGSSRAVASSICEKAPTVLPTKEDVLKDRLLVEAYTAPPSMHAWLPLKLLLLAVSSLLSSTRAPPLPAVRDVPRKGTNWMVLLQEPWHSAAPVSVSFLNGSLQLECLSDAVTIKNVHAIGFLQ